MRVFHILFFLFIGSGCFSQNNLIHNAGFEINTGNWPSSHSQVNRLSVWEDNLDNVVCDPAEHFFHSPDFFYTDGQFHLVKGPTNSPVTARNGFGYVGMSRGELIEQQLFSSNPLQNGKEYEVSMYFKFPGVAHTWFFGIQQANFTANPASNVNLKVFIGTNKIKYKDRPNCSGVNAWEFSDDYCDLKDGVFNDVDEIASFNLNASSFPVDIWHKLSQRFVVPNNNKNYQWIAFEVQCDGETSASSKYILLDDMMLTEACALNCTQTGGSMDPQIATYNQMGCAAAQVSNISNVRELKMEIFNSLGQLIRTLNFFNTNGFSSPVYWDGLTPNGATAAFGAYVVKVTCKNDCGDFIRSATIAWTGCGTTGPPANPPTSVVSDIKYNDCCELEHSFNGKTFNSFIPGQHPYSYKPRNNIYINSCYFTPISKSTFKAGREIKITGETVISPGTAPYGSYYPEFHALIEECPDAHRFFNSIESAPDQVKSYSSLKNKDQSELMSLNIMPNPGSGVYTIYSASVTECSIDVFDIRGSLIKSVKISETNRVVDLSESNSGIYIFIVKLNDGTLRNLKVIKE